MRAVESARAGRPSTCAWGKMEGRVRRGGQRKLLSVRQLQPRRPPLPALCSSDGFHSTGCGTESDQPALLIHSRPYPQNDVNDSQHPNADRQFNTVHAFMHAGLKTRMHSAIMCDERQVGRAAEPEVGGPDPNPPSQRAQRGQPPRAAGSAMPHPRPPEAQPKSQYACSTHAAAENPSLGYMNAHAQAHLRPAMP
jgi:hypothetical protein